MSFELGDADKYQKEIANRADTTVPLNCPTCEGNRLKADFLRLFHSNGGEESHFLELTCKSCARTRLFSISQLED